ncbi:MAG: zf-HC2 domain-containing protein [Acidobacteria bacterium]|nr:zf-HC2 domain-containing protein [Acidobacteriota bacterium]
MCTDANHESLVGSLYSELTSDEQRAFDAHLQACAECRGELNALRRVRDDLVSWAPPECRDLPSSWAVAPAPPAPMARLTTWAPAFALAAAAMLVLAAAASIANLDVRYDDQGFAVRTGRSAVTEVERAAAPAPETAPVTASFVTAEELAAFEARLRTSLSGPSGSEPDGRAPVQAVSLSSANPQLPPGVGRLPADVRRWIEESEARTRSEMAARFLDIVSDLEGHRRTDMLRVQQALGQLQRTSGAEAAQTRDIVNRLMLVSSGQQQPPR